ncbi:hypothetical protein O181_081060 [Austropuccinia psidii MF-1]|uniref:Uncharacterized protein n=1 Tax=Austropuccinia psidii MF-1 TaxID=1389203 RepID=A0A9Q3IJH9_9BASI|nr:hypothetical protein [Austropuccinia psidii MF-1]
MAAKQQDWELLLSLWICTMNSYIQMKKFIGPKKTQRTSEGLETHVLQGKGPTDKSLVENPKHVVRGPEEEVGPKKEQQPSGSSPSLHKQKSTSKSAKTEQSNPKGQSKGKRKGKIKVEQTLPTELQNSEEREDSQPWTMCSIWQEL